MRACLSPAGCLPLPPPVVCGAGPGTASAGAGAGWQPTGAALRYSTLLPLWSTYPAAFLCKAQLGAARLSSRRSGEGDPLSPLPQAHCSPCCVPAWPTARGCMYPKLALWLATPVWVPRAERAAVAASTPCSMPERGARVLALLLLWLLLLFPPHPPASRTRPFCDRLSARHVSTRAHRQSHAFGAPRAC